MTKKTKKQPSPAMPVFEPSPAIPVFEPEKFTGFIDAPESDCFGPYEPKTDYFGKMDEPDCFGEYMDSLKPLTKLPDSKPITLLQFMKLLHPETEIRVRPNIHFEYYHGDMLLIPREMYMWEVTDISFRDEKVIFYVPRDKKYDEYCTEKEVKKINDYFCL